MSPGTGVVRMRARPTQAGGVVRGPLGLPLPGVRFAGTSMSLNFEFFSGLFSRYAW